MTPQITMTSVPLSAHTNMQDMYILI